MKVTLNIEEDEKLRSYIKDCIKGQVLSVSREEIKDILLNEIQSKIKDGYISRFEYILKDATKKAVKETLSLQKLSTNIEIIEKVEDALEKMDWKKLVNKIATKKMKDLMKSM